MSVIEMFRVKTAHKTSVFVDVTLNLIVHQSEMSTTNVPLYARRLNGRYWQFFFVQNRSMKFLEAIDSGGRALVSELPIDIPGGEIQYISAIGTKDKRSEMFNAHSSIALIFNELDNTITIRQHDQYWSAHKSTGRFWLAPRNSTWEHFRLEPVDAMQIGNIDAIILASDETAVDELLERLQDVNIIAVLMKNKTPEELEAFRQTKNIPAASFNAIEKFTVSERECLWLIAGENIAEARNVSTHLQSLGVSSANIVNCNAKMRVTSTFISNMEAVGGCDFIALGDAGAATAIDVDMINARKGLNLAAEHQDLRQSLLIARRVFEHCNSIRFVLLGLTPELLSDDDATFFSEQNLGSQYFFSDVEMSPIAKMFGDLFLKPPSPKAEVEPEPIEMFSRASSGLELNENNLRALEEIIQLCLEHGAMPVLTLLPKAEGFRRTLPRGMIELMRRTLGILSKAYAIRFVDFYELPLGAEVFVDAMRLSSGGAATMSNVLNYELHKRGVLPFEEMRFVDYERIYGLMSFLDRAEYNEMLRRLFDATLETLKRKPKIKVGFVLYDASMWCGDALYNFFDRDERFETTVFVCLRKDNKNELILENFNKAVENFKAGGLNVRSVVTNKETIPKQDVLIYLTPYFHYLPMAFRTYNLTPETLLAYVPYTLGVDYLSIVSFKIHFIVWKLFSCTNEFRRSLIRNDKVDAARMIYSGSPKMDLFFAEDNANRFEWKTARSDAVKIIWAPHWSIKGRPYVRFATFHLNYKFLYEYAKNHPETSWVVKPHPNLFSSAVTTGVFPSLEAFKQYLDDWDALPNARVVIGGYYQDVFRSSDGMILDSCSFVAEYQYTHKPMLFLTRKTTNHNPLGKALVNANYHVDGADFDGIAKFIEDVLIKRNDTQLEARNRVFDAELNYRKENGMPASEMIFRTIASAVSK